MMEIREAKTEELAGARHVTRMEEMKTVYDVSVDKT